MLNIQFVDLEKCHSYEYIWLELKLIHLINSSWLDDIKESFDYFHSIFES